MNEVIRLILPRVLHQIGVHGLLLIEFEELVGVDFNAHEKLLAPFIDFSEWPHLVDQLQDKGEKLKMGVEGEVKVRPDLQEIFEVKSEALFLKALFHAVGKLLVQQKGCVWVTLDFFEERDETGDFIEF